LNKKGQLTATASPAQPRRPEILRLATATALYGGGGNFLRLATPYELYDGGSGVYVMAFSIYYWANYTQGKTKLSRKS